MNAEVEGEDEMHPSKRPRVGERVPIHVPSKVEPQNRDFNVNEFLLSSPNPVVASVFWDSEIIQRAAVRRGIPSGRPFSTVPLLLECESALMENERHNIGLGGFLVRNTGNCWDHGSRGKSCGRHELESTFQSKTSERALCV